MPILWRTVHYPLVRLSHLFGAPIGFHCLNKEERLQNELRFPNQEGGFPMTRHILIVVACTLFVAVVFAMAGADASAQSPPAAVSQPGYVGGSYGAQDWNRLYHYPYVYYPQNFYPQEYYRSSNSMVHRYPPEMRIPAYNRSWQNYYPAPRRYHMGHHFILDVF